MAKRPVFMPAERRPYVREREFEFTWHSGFARSQKQKSIQSLHEAWLACPYGKGKRILEVSQYSEGEDGKALSAFRLMKYVPSLGKSVPVECIFQAGKVFENGGPYTDLLEKMPKEAKKDERLRSSGRITGFVFEGVLYPNEPQTAFYDWIYLNACLENPETAARMMQYDAFTDIAFNPEKSLNCQAKACAKYVSLARSGKLEEVRDFSRFISL